MNHTQNYQLNQWEATDRVLRTDFNADNAKIDAALTQKCEIVAGTYTGSTIAFKSVGSGISVATNHSNMDFRYIAFF